jgi:hypothetical protein
MVMRSEPKRRIHASTWPVSRTAIVPITTRSAPAASRHSTSLAAHATAGLHANVSPLIEAHAIERLPAGTARVRSDQVQPVARRLAHSLGLEPSGRAS